MDFTSEAKIVRLLSGFKVQEPTFRINFMITKDIVVDGAEYKLTLTDQVLNQVDNLKALYATAAEDPESFEQVSAQISNSIQEITSSVTPTENDNHLDGLIQEIIKIADNQAVQAEKQTKEKTKKSTKK